MVNPSIEELHKSEDFELIDELHHKQIKEFVIGQLSNGGWMVKTYMVYQLLMLAFGAFLIIRSIVLSYNGSSRAFFFILGAFVFCFSLLIVLHELLHGIAIKLTGAKKVNYGAYLKKFIFYVQNIRKNNIIAVK